MIKKVSDFYELNKILRTQLLEQTGLPNDHILNGLSVHGNMLEKRLEEQIFVPFKINDSFIVFELIPRNSTSDTTQTIDDSLLITSSFTFKLVIYGKSSMLAAKIIKARFQSEEVRQLLFNEGIYIESITNSEGMNDFINNTMWLRTDVAIEISCETEIEKITSYEFENLGELKVGPPFDEEEPPIPPEEWSYFVTIYLTEQSGKSFTVYSGNQEYGIDWGDGTIDENFIHEYAEYGEYIIKLKGRLEVEPQWGEFGGDLQFGALSSIDTVNTQGLAVTKVECFNASVGKCAFAYCQNISEIIFSEQQASIPDYCFYNSGITNIASIQHFDNIHSIGLAAFRGCSYMTSFTIPSNVREIKSQAFNGAATEDQISVSISGDDNYSIDLSGSRIFDGVYLSTIYLPNKISAIGQKFLYNNRGIVDVYYDGTYEEWSQIDIDSNWAYQYRLHYNEEE